MSALPPSARVVFRELEGGMRLVLELDRSSAPETSRRMAERLDRVRNLLLLGEVSPDEAFGMLLDCSWLRPENHDPLSLDEEADAGGRRAELFASLFRKPPEERIPSTAVIELEDLPHLPPGERLEDPFPV